MSRVHSNVIPLVGVSVLALPSFVHAQTAPTTPADALTEVTVTVTGSRVIKNGNDSPIPVTVVQPQDLLALAPGNLNNSINDLPVFAGSRGTQANPAVAGSAAAGFGASNSLNLRDLGPIRTLVLEDGHRVAPTSFNNAVDVDIIPQMLVQRVDVVTGGVSAVYGSDAVAGVVNYIIDKRFEGVRIDTDFGVSQRGDDQRQDVGIAVGKSLFDGSGHFEASYQFLNSEGISARADRPYLAEVGFSGAGTVANPYVISNNLRQSSSPFGGLIGGAAGKTNPLGGMTFASNGVLSPFVNGVATGTNGLQVGGGGGYYDSTLIAPERANQAFARYDQSFSDSIHGYLQFGSDIKRDESFADNIQLSGVTLSSTNAFLPAAYQAQLAAAGQKTFSFSELMGDFSRFHAIETAYQYTYMGGLDGLLGKYRWGLDASYGDTKLSTEIQQNLNSQNLAASLDAVVNPANGQIVCNASLTNSAYSNCVPIDVFGPTAQSPAALAYIAPTTRFTGRTQLEDFSGHFDGAPFALPTGDVNTALSAEWRKLSFNSSTDAPATAFESCTGIRYNCSATTGVWYSSFANQAPISQSVGEVAFEASLPVLKNLPFIQDLSINGATRYTHYSTSGDYVTWKVGLDWKVDDLIRFRATRSRDIRAPTLYELFAQPTLTTVKPLDLLTNQSLSTPSTTLSNTHLTAERATTTTAGMVLNPLPRLSFSLDAYRITIDNAITTVTGSTNSLQQACYASGGTSVFCSLQTRALDSYTDASPANYVTHWYIQYLNIAQLDTYGVDFEGNYAATLLGLPTAFRLLAAYQPHQTSVVPGSATIDQAGAGFGANGATPQPVVRVTGFVTLNLTDNVTFLALERWRNAMKYSGDPTAVIVDNHIAAFGTTDVTLSYDHPTPFGSKTQFYFNITNLFDTRAPIGAYVGNGTRAGLRDGFVQGDDVVGRAFTIGARLRY